MREGTDWIRTLTFAKEGCLGDTTSKQSRWNKRNLDKLLWGRKKLQKVVHSARAKVLQGTMKKCWNNLEDSMGRQFGHPWLRLQAAFARVPKIDWNKESDTSILKSLPCVGWFLRIAWDMLASHSLYKWFFQEGSTSRAEKQNSIDANREMWTAEKGKDLQLEMWLSELLLSKSFDLKKPKILTVHAWDSKKKIERFAVHKVFASPSHQVTRLGLRLWDHQIWFWCSSQSSCEDRDRSWPGMRSAAIKKDDNMYLKVLKYPGCPQNHRKPSKTHWCDF